MKTMRLGRKGFTLIELLVGSVIMLIVIVAALSVYARSNKVAVDQQQFADVQNDVRSALYFISRDVRNAGVGLTQDVAGYFLEGQDAIGPDPESADSLRIFGNFDDNLNLQIETYSLGSGSSATANLYTGQLQNAPYDCPSFYENRVLLLVSTTSPGCFVYQATGSNAVQGCGMGAEQFIFSNFTPSLYPPGGQIQTSLCGSDCWDNSIVTIGQVKLYWLDTTGNLSNFDEFSLSAGTNGYLGIPNVLYLTETNAQGQIIHMPLARNIENLQFQYNGDLNNDGTLDGFTDWDNNWTIHSTDSSAQRQAKLDIISRIRQVQMWVVGRTENAVVSFTGTPPEVSPYRRPGIANTLAATTNDMHRRFVLESISNIRNLTINIYNTGER